jgi:hypothetical protein
MLRTRFIALGRPATAAVAADAATTYVGTTNDASTTSSVFTFAAHSFGTSSNANRALVVGYSGRDTAALRTLTGATIGGITATIGAQQANNGAQKAHTGFVAAVVGTASSGDIVLTFDGIVNRGVCVFVYSVENLSSVTATDSDVTDTADAYVSSIDVQAGGVVFAVGHEGGGVGSTMSGTSLTVDADDVSSANAMGSAGHRDTSTALTGYAITYDASDTQSGASFVAYR